jgi:4-diphosphocytidyl-2-C-methyl-D-erythritol kinase
MKANAKLNLNLHVKGKRPDGYHLLESDVIFLSLADELHFEAADDLQVISSIPDNLIAKAARLIAPDIIKSGRGVKITLTKNIPMGGGLGGGSADAAATLVGLKEFFDISMPESALYEMALKLGADVPCCLYNQLTGKNAVHFCGIGEVLTPAPLAPNWHFLLVNPNLHMDTASVFKAYDGLGEGDNHLQTTAIKLMPEIGQVLALLESTNPIFARMTGSGATCFAVYKTADQAQNAASQIPDKYYKNVCVAA